MTHNLKDLQKAADKICAAAYEKRHTFENAAVNWRHFKCVDAQFCISYDGAKSYRVIIEEADPENPEVRSFIADELAVMGFMDVEVVTEW